MKTGRLGLTIALTALLSLGSGIARAAGADDVVMLTNGGRLRGVVMEEDPGKGVTIRLPDGTVRAVKPSLVARVDYAKPAPAPEPRPEPVAAPSPDPVETPAPQPQATVVVRATRPGTVIREMKDPRVAPVSGPSGTGGAAEPSVVDLCEAPCRLTLPPGFHRLELVGPGGASAVENFDIRPGENHLLAKPGNPTAGRWGAVLAATGLIFAVTGGVLAATAGPAGLPNNVQGGFELMTGGALLSLLAIPMIQAGSSSFSPDTAARTALLPHPAPAKTFRLSLAF